MSKFSGRADLYDLMCGQGGWYTKDGTPIKLNEDTGPYYSDEYLDFLEFKRKTKGTLYQRHKVTVTEYNQEFVKEHCQAFNYIRHERVVADKRCKDDKRTEYFYEYHYYDKKYTLKELNKHGVYVTIDIHFDTILDLIPYYPYIVSSCYSDDEKEKVFISKESSVISEQDEFYERGHFSDSWQWYTKELQEHYFEICRDILCYKLEERTKTVTITSDRLLCPVEPEDGDYVIPVDDEIDCNHRLEFVWDDETIHTHWTSPKRDGLHDIIISRQDVEGFLKDDIKNGTVKVKYVKKREHELCLH